MGIARRRPQANRLRRLREWEPPVPKPFELVHSMAQALHRRLCEKLGLENGTDAAEKLGSSKVFAPQPHRLLCQSALRLNPCGHVMN